MPRRDSDAWHWQRRAECAKHDPEIWFPTKGSEEASAPAVRICLTCPVINECAAHAFRYNEVYGVWGGLGEFKREAMRKGKRRKDGSWAGK